MSEKRITVAGIEATLLRKKVKNLRVTIVPPDGEVRVSAPKLMPEALIRAFLLEKADWIRTHVEKVKKATQTSRSSTKAAKRSSCSGRSIPFAFSKTKRKTASRSTPDASCFL